MRKATLIWHVTSALVLSALALPGAAQAGADAKDPYVAQLEASGKGKGWLQSELFRFKVFPHLDKAEQLIRAARKADALAELKRALEVSGEQPVIRLRVMTFAWHIGDGQETLAQANALLAIHKDFVPALLHRAFALQKSGRNDEALADFERVARSAGATPGDRNLALRSWADGAIQQQKFEPARMALDTLWTQDKSYALGMKLGRVLLALGMRDEARSIFEETAPLAGTKDERSAVAIELVELCQQDGDFTSAQQWVERALAEKAEDIDLQRRLSLLAGKNRDRRTAVEAAALSFQQSGRFDDLELLSNLLIRQGQFTKAAHHLQRWLAGHSGDPNRAQALVLLGQARLAQGKHAASLAAFEKALPLTRGVDTYLTVANLQDQLGRPADAVATLEQGLRKQPSAELFFRLGIEKQKIGDKAGAIQNLRSALALGLPAGRELRAWRTLGYLYQATGEAKQSVAIIAMALQRHPNDVELHRMQASNYTGLRQYDKALEHLEQGARLSASPAIRYDLAFALEAHGDEARALTILESLVGSGRAPGEPAELWLHIGHLRHKQHKPELAADAYLQAFASAAKPKAEWLLMAGSALVAAHRDERAHRVLLRAVSSDQLSPRDKARALEMLGVLESQRGHSDKATTYFVQALANGSQSPQVKLSLARCYEAQKRVPEAIRNLQEGIDAQPGLDGPARAELERELARLHFAANDPQSAEKILRVSLERQRHPETLLLLARALRIGGEPDGALQMLSELEEKQRPQAIELERLDELSLILAQKEQPARAASAVEKALQLQKTPERLYRYALLLKQSQRPGDAIPPLVEAVAREPNNSLYREELSVLLLAVGSKRESSELLEEALANSKDRAAMHANLAYLYKQMGDNRKAVTHFRAAIDELSDAAPAAGDASERIYRYRSEVSTLTEMFGAVVYYTYSTDRRAPRSILGQLEPGVATSSGGLELSFQPPWIGYRHGRRLQLYGRFLWNTMPDSRFDERSYQAGLGLRYQPFASQNLYLAAERLIKVGDYATNNWLFRLQYGIGSGQGLVFGKRVYDHTSLYSELDGFADQPRFAALNLMLRQGVTWNPNDKILITPHVLGAAKLQWPDDQQLSSVEAGAGISLSHLFAGTRYQIHRASLEFSLQYKFGRFLSDDLKSDRGYRGLYLTGIFRI